MAAFHMHTFTFVLPKLLWESAAGWEQLCYV